MLSFCGGDESFKQRQIVVKQSKLTMKTLKSIICLSIVFFSKCPNSLLFACSSIVLKNDTSIFLAKNFDWTYGEGYLIKNPRGVHKTAFYTSNSTPASWTSKFGSVTFNQNGKEMPYGGMNEEGLAIEMLWLDYTEYFNEQTNPYLNELEWIQYQLDNYTKVAQVIEHINHLSIQPFKGKIHFMVADADGNSIVIEHIAGKIKYEEKLAHQCQTITNYDISASKAWYANKATAFTGNVTNPLYRYTLLQSEIDKNDFATVLSAKATLKILDDVTIKKGDFKTFWSIVYDLKKKEVYFKSFNAKNVKHFALSGLNFDTQPQAVEINTKAQGNIGQLFNAYSQQMNTQLVANSLTQLGLERLNFAELSKHQFEFSSPIANSYTNNYAALKISITTDNNTKLGKLGIIIIDNEENLKNFKPYRDGTHKIMLTQPTYSWVYYGLPQGNYVIAAAQDSNDNRRPDFDTEKYAFTKEAKVVNGVLPSFEDCKVAVKEGINAISLVLKN